MSNTSENQVPTTTDNKSTKGPDIVVKDYNEEALGGDWVKIVFKINEKIGKLKPIHECEDNKSHQVVLYVAKGATWKDIAYYIPEVEFTGDNENQYPRWTPEFPDNDKTTAKDGDKEFTVCPVDNPWEEFYEDTKERKQYIATGDRGYIARYMHENNSSKLVFNTLPGPFFGNITTAKVVLLLNNPGLHLKDNKKEESAAAVEAQCDFCRRIGLANLNEEKACGYYFIDPAKDLSQLNQKQSPAEFHTGFEQNIEIDLSYLQPTKKGKLKDLLLKNERLKDQLKDQLKDLKNQNKISLRNMLPDDKRLIRVLSLIGTLYWQGEIKPLIEDGVTYDDLLKHFAFINHFPYHSSDSSNDDFDNSELLKLPTRKYTAHLLKDAIEKRDATIILARAEKSNKKWYEEYFGSQSFTYHYRCTNPRSWSFEKMLTREEYDEIENLKMPKNFKCLKEKFKEA